MERFESLLVNRKGIINNCNIYIYIYIFILHLYVISYLIQYYILTLKRNYQQKYLTY